MLEAFQSGRDVRAGSSKCCGPESPRSSEPTTPEDSTLVPEEVRILLQNQALEYSNRVQEAIRRFSKDPYDLVEVCSPWDSPLRIAVEGAGGKVFRMGIRNGYDLSTQAGLIKALLTLLRELRPWYVHVSRPCFPWSPLSHTNQRNPQQITSLQANRQHGRLILKNCLKIVQVQRQELNGQSGMGPDCQEAHAGGEQPLRAESWKEPTVRKILSLCGEGFRCNGCRFGMKDEETGTPVQKPCSSRVRLGSRRP